MASDAFSEPHGGPDPQELALLGFCASDIVDFSANSNPFGPSPLVHQAIVGVDVSLYPDRECAQLRDDLAGLNRVAPENVLVANGSAELVWLASQAMLAPGDLAMVVGPTFGEYARAAAGVGADVMEIRAHEPDFLLPVTELVRSISTHRPRLLFLCNPNNPTGRALAEEDISAIADACPPGTLPVIDEAYRAFLEGDPFSVPYKRRCLVLRSMTKDFAIAGLRLGYALGEPEVLRRMAGFQPAWSVNSMAQAAGRAALKDIAYYRKTLTELRALRDGFFRKLRHAGVRLAHSDTHFALAFLDEPARLVRQRLLRRGIQVRDCASFGLPRHIRVSTHLEEQNRRLVDALAGDAVKGG